MENQNDKKLGLSLLVALGVGSMIGGGIFNSPTDLIGVANPKAAMIAWVIGGFGILMLALVFQLLANRRPELTGGIFTYAKDGFGDFVGFNSAWGYWLSAWTGNVAFIILLFKTVNSLVGNMSPIVTFILASALVWIIHYIQTKGTKNAGILNFIATVAKIIPLLMVIVLGILIFKSGTFNVANWQTQLASAASKSAAGTTLFAQIKSAMGTILWCFIGVEAATVLSERAKSQKIVGTATVLSLVATLVLYMLISLAAMGSVPAKTLAGSSMPLADVLAKTSIGSVGAVIVKLGLIISLLGSLISWVMLSAEIPFVAAQGGTMPKWFAKVNKNEVPVNALLITNVLTQLFLLSILSPALQSAYSSVYTLATACILVPYLLSAMYAVKVSAKDKLSAGSWLISILACVYAIYVLYAVGIKSLAETAIMYAIGILVYVKARKEKGEQIGSGEKIGMVVLALIGIVMIVLIASGKVAL